MAMSRLGALDKSEKVNLYTKIEDLVIGSCGRFAKGGKRRQELLQKGKVFASVDSDKSASVSVAGGASSAGSDVAVPMDSSAKVLLAVFTETAPFSLSEWVSRV